MVVSTHRKMLDFSGIELSICNSSLERVEQFKYLGVVLDPLLNFKCHVDMICSKVSKKLGVLKRCKLYIDCNTMKTLYKSIVIPHFDYCDTVYDACGKGLKDRLQRLQNRGLRLVLSQKPRTASDTLHAEANVRKLQQSRDFHLSCLMFNVLNGLAPKYMSAMFCKISAKHNVNTRSASEGDLYVKRAHKEVGKKSLSYRGAEAWNNLCTEVRNSENINQFKDNYLAKYYNVR